MVRIFGVRFQWGFDQLGYGFDPSNQEERKAILHGVRQAIGDAMRRQQRERLRYWDLMTFLERVHLPREVANSKEAQVAHDLILTIDDPQGMREQTIKRLVALRAMRHVSTELLWRKPADPVEATLAELEVDGRPCAVKSPFQRVITVDMVGLAIDIRKIPWHRLMVLAILAHLRADLEIYSETGYMSVRKCQRHSCSAWYRAERMAGRQRFCSAACRVAYSRGT